MTIPPPVQGDRVSSFSLLAERTNRRVSRQKVFIFGNPDVDNDSLPVKLLPQLCATFPDINFVHLDPNEEWGDIPEHFVIIDTVLGIDDVTVFDNLEKLEQTALVSLHDFDVTANLKWLQKLDKIKKITIIGLPNTHPPESWYHAFMQVFSNVVNRYQTVRQCDSCHCERTE